jgi:Kdo2-lipid IVA lauroyltransferase/acyltransferase
LPRFKTTIIHPLEYGLFRLVVFLVWICPEKTARWLGRVLGAVAWNVFGLRRNEVLESMSRAFPEKSEESLEQLGAGCYRNLGEYFVEMFRIHRMSTAWMERHISLEGREVMDSALAEGKGVINVGFHYGDWELSGAYFGRLGYPLDVIARKQSNRFFQRYVTAMREASGWRMLLVESSPKKIGRALRNGRIVVFQVDQDSHHQGVFVDFLGRPASTPKGPALFAHKTGAPVVLSLMLPQGEGKWKLLFERVPRPETTDRDEFVLQMTRSFTHRLAEQVRAHPEPWFWPHRRWKTKPVV